MKKINLTIALSLLVYCIIGQTFQKRYSLSNNSPFTGLSTENIAFDVTSNSIYIQTNQHDGHSNPPGLMKLDTCGNILWAKHHTPVSISFQNSNMTGSAGSAYLGMYTVLSRDGLNGPTVTNSFITTVKTYSSNGILLSNNGFYTNASSTEPYDAQLLSSKRLPNGDILGVGFASRTNNYKDFLFCKLSPSGNVIWSKLNGHIGALDWDCGFGCDYDPVNLSAYFVGYSKSFGPDRDIHIIKTDISGNILWAKNYNATSGNDYGWCIKVLSNQDVVVVGTKASGANDDIIFIKLDQLGNILTSCKYQGAGSQDFVNNINTLPNGNLLLTGYTNSFGFGGIDALNMEVDLNGNIMWQKAYGTISDDVFKNALIYNNSIYSSGSVKTGTGDSTKRVYFVKTKLDGSFSNTGCSSLNGNFIKVPLNFVSTNAINVLNSGLNMAVATSTFNSVISQTHVCGIPTASFTASTNVCINQAVILNNLSNGATTYTWHSTANNILMPNLQNQPPITFSAAGTYTVKLKVSSCAGGIDSISKVVIVNPNGVLTPTANSPICAGATLSLNLSGTGVPIWSGPNNFGSNSFSATITNAQTISTGIYTVNVTNSLGCLSTGTVAVSVYSIPNLTILNSGSNPICLLNSTTLSAVGATNYTWLPTGQTTQSIQLSPTNNITYSLIGVSSPANCKNTAVYNVSVTPLPVISVNGNSLICYGETTQLYAFGASSYTWNCVSEAFTSVSNPIKISPVSTTVYSVIGSNNGCINSSTYTINVVNYPNLQISADRQQICQGEFAKISASGCQGYVWEPFSIYTSTTQTLAIVNPATTSEYTIRGFNSFGSKVCSSQKMMTIIVIPQVTLTINDKKVICEGQETELFAGGGNTYLWIPDSYITQNNASHIVVKPISSTIYTVNVSNLGSCGQNGTVAVIVNPNPKVFAGRDTVFNLDEPKFLNASGTGTLTWTSGDNIFCNVCPKTSISPINSNCYTVESINEFNCKAFDEVCIEITRESEIYVPNSFTPNGDGLNDMFFVYGSSIVDLYMEVFDRWGEKLFSSDSQHNGWDGTFKGISCKNDVYVYILNYKMLDNRKYTKTGTVTLTN